MGAGRHLFFKLIPCPVAVGNRIRSELIDLHFQFGSTAARKVFSGDLFCAVASSAPGYFILAPGTADLIALSYFFLMVALKAGRRRNPQFSAGLLEFCIVPMVSVAQQVGIEMSIFMEYGMFNHVLGIIPREELF